jgi:hypothetical protein
MSTVRIQHKAQGTRPAPLRRIVQRCIKPVHVFLRQRRLDLFFRLARVMETDTLLDVGGGLGVGGELERLYHAFKTVTIANPRPSPGTPSPNRCTRVSADGCALPFKSRSFDWVFSNAVIEHVGGWKNQKFFASEIRRVARKGYFIATPNRYFLVEQHTLLPGYQFLPRGLQRAVLMLSPGYVEEYEPIWLLSVRELRSLCPGACIFRTGIPGLPNTIVAFCDAL